MATVTPVTQSVHLDPFNGRLFEFNNVDSRIYLTHTINSLLDIYGNNTIIEGLSVDSATLVYNSTANTLAFNIIKGSCVIDQTLAAITVDEAISINTAGTALASASFAIFANFEYLQQFGGNKLSLDIIWMDSAGNTANGSADVLARDRILLAVIDFDAAGAVPSIRNASAYNVTTLSGSFTTATINGAAHVIYPRSKISDNLARILLDTFY